ncbi:immunoglobulin-like domain-containing protein [Chryseobacterium echinoideorum]|uniref:immunoglobulin-like domain-containing protein n=1 Tax=Chryseobacterium echinoideorum TaxID=1549648 RepID=UPI0016246B9A|nr:immunoglobulin-like domain-containing protein [Chryseobacterium echinoideorum]
MATISFIISCSSDSDTIGVSRVTQYPDFNYNPVVAVPLGGSFSTGDVTAFEGSTELTVNVDGSVNTNAIGAYEITYSAQNSDGFNAIVTQTVVVYNPSGSGIDVSGKIKDVNNDKRTGVISLVPGTPNIYYCTDFGFAGAFPVYFEMNGNVPSAIPQAFNGYDPTTSVSMDYNPTTKKFTIDILPYGYSYGFEYYD